MAEKSTLRDLPPNRFGEVVADVLSAEWEGDVERSPASPGGAVEAVVTTEDGRRLVHFRQDGRVDAEVVRTIAELSAERGFDATTLVTTGRFSEAARAAATETDVTLADGEELAAMVEAAGVDVDVDDEPTAAALAMQLAGRWPGGLRERAVEVAATIDGVADFDREVTRASERTDVDFTPDGSRDPVTRLRFTETSLLVYVRRGPTLESVVRLTAKRDEQPPLATLADDLEERVRAAIEERSG